MGVSTDAILVYGFDVGEDVPWENFDEDQHTEQSNPLGYKAYIGGDEDGVELVRHCSDACTMYIVGIKESKTQAWRGDPAEIKTLDIKPEWDERLEKFCKKHGIEHPSPSWLLASWWG